MSAGDGGNVGPGRIGRRTVLVAGIGAGISLGVSGIARSAAPTARAGDPPSGNPSDTDPVVVTTHGPVRGLRDRGVQVFRGVRYGADTGPVRFRAPLPPRPWTDVADATAFGPACPQRGLRDAVSEDCLFLNVWTPGAEAGARRPVIVYIHGGAYASGSGADPLTDGARLAAAGDVVVVTVNHRLNAFGYAYLARLSPRFPDSGNAGMLDLVLALRWVRANIAAFGGDPACVTLVGQSGGGAKIATLMGMPTAAGLFHRAVTMSGQQVTASGPLNATARARTFLDALSIPPDRVEGLLDLPAARLVEGLAATDPILGGGLYFGPVLDQQSLVRQPFWPDANPLSAHIPMILGNTRDETRGFVRKTDDPLFSLTWEDLPARLAEGMRVDILPEHVAAIYRRLYPTLSPADIYFAATTAGRSWRGQVIEAELRAAADSPTWVYQLDYRSPVDGGRWGAYHSGDIPLLFGTQDAPTSRSGTGPAAQAAGAVLQSVILAFARSGDPAVPGLPAWPQYRTEREGGTRATLIVDATPTIAQDPRGDERRLFAAVPYIQPGT